MRDDVIAVEGATPGQRASNWRESLRDAVLRKALVKWANGVPTVSVPEAAALLSVSQEHLYRLVQAGGFPAIRLGVTGKQGRYVVPTAALNGLLSAAADAGACVDAGEWTQEWQAARVNTAEVA